MAFACVRAARVSNSGEAGDSVGRSLRESAAHDHEPFFGPADGIGQPVKATNARRSSVSPPFIDRPAHPTCTPDRSCASCTYRSAAPDLRHDQPPRPTHATRAHDTMYLNAGSPCALRNSRNK
eukprot:5380273-Prymnesium_polylepis.2